MEGGISDVNRKGGHITLLLTLTLTLTLTLLTLITLILQPVEDGGLPSIVKA